jgi:hypothetical protein
LKYSRWVRVSLVPDEGVESLVRTLAEHLASWGGRPLLCVFDRPKTIALKWRKNGEVTEWNPVFAYATLEMGVGVELCWPYRAQQKGSVENLVGFVKSSFFKVRRFHDEEDLRQQLRDWHREVNQERPCRATGIIPALRHITRRRPSLRRKLCEVFLFLLFLLSGAGRSGPGRAVFWRGESAPLTARTDAKAWAREEKTCSHACKISVTTEAARMSKNASNPDSEPTSNKLQFAEGQLESLFRRLNLRAPNAIGFLAGFHLKALAQRVEAEATNGEESVNVYESAAPSTPRPCQEKSAPALGFRPSCADYSPRDRKRPGHVQVSSSSDPSGMRT